MFQVVLTLLHAPTMINALRVLSAVLMGGAVALMAQTFAWTTPAVLIVIPQIVASRVVLAQAMGCAAMVRVAIVSTATA
jgi:hypothetical protein